jgi:hypothetical protein
MADNSDPRHKLATYANTTGEGNSSPELATFYDSEPQESENGTKSWYVRGQNFVLVMTEAAPGATLTRLGQVDEYVVILEHESTPADVTWEGQQESIPGYSIVMIPPGDSSVHLPNGGRVTRLFTSKSVDLVAKCPNAVSYLTPKPHVAPYVAWPDPVGGWKIRSYSFNVPPAPGGFAKMYRSTNFMINLFQEFVGPRDPLRMSPHSHDDFEQCSFALQGEWVHSLRWAWGTNLNEWREDEHVACSAPSVLVIPATTIHSSRWISEGKNQLVDIFSPPRVDFSKIEGWVLNSDDYPMPDGA